MLVQTCWISVSTDWQLDVNEAYQSFQVLFMQLYVVMAGTVHPQWLHCARTTLVDHLTVRKVDNFIISSMDNKNHRRDAGHFIDAKNSMADDIKVKKETNSIIQNTCINKYRFTTYTIKWL